MSRHVAMLLVGFGSLVHAASPAPTGKAPLPAIARENQPPPVVQPRNGPPKKPRFKQQRLGRPFAGEGTPLVFSVTPGLVLRGVSDASFEFEPGEPVRSAWPDAKTAWLVRDLDGDGQVTSGRELFGSFSVRDGVRATNGFEALAWLDENGDGVVSAADPAQAGLRFWFDRDGDRRASPSELMPVSVALPVRFEVRAVCDTAGNCVKERARLEGGWLLDVHLKFSRVRAEPRG